jgi:peptidoglycan/xylan/chitin deacetylase (PgdA/CDA1 family)
MLNKLSFLKPELILNIKHGFVLAYHDISVPRFEEHLDLLSKFEVIPLSELLFRKFNGLSNSGLYAITIDDAYRKTIVPLIDSLNVPITIFVQTDAIDGIVPDYVRFYVFEIFSKKTIILAEYFDNNENKRDIFIKNVQNALYSMNSVNFNHYCSPFEVFLRSKGYISNEFLNNFLPCIDEQTISSLSSNNLVSIQSHGQSHQPVSSLSNGELESELKNSKSILQSITSKEPTIFCYPFGQSISIGDNAPRIVGKHYNYAVTMNSGLLKENENPYLIPRIPLYEKDFQLRFLMKLIKSKLI